MKIKADASLFLLGAGAAAAWYLYGKRKAIETALNPTSSKNIAYQGASSVVQTLTGQKNTTLGTWLYDIFNPGAGSSATATTPLPAGSPGWWTSKGLPIPPGVTSDPTTWTTLGM